MIAVVLDLALTGATVAVLVRRAREAHRTRGQQRQWQDFIAGHDLHDGR
ncbi:MAG: hypothetical protein ABI384_04945 [Allobranchiibius sp.]